MKSICVFSVLFPVCVYAQNCHFNTIGLLDNTKKEKNVIIPVVHQDDGSIPSDTVINITGSDFHVPVTIDRVVSNIDNELTLVNLYREMERVGLKQKFYVMAQAILETGCFSSNVCHSYNNIFGLYDSRKKDYYRFEKWQDSVDAYYKYIQCRYKGGDYLAFLNKIGYAEDPLYTNKVNKIYNRIINALK